MQQICRPRQRGLIDAGYTCVSNSATTTRDGCRPGAPVVAFSQAMDQTRDELRFALLNWVYRDLRITKIMGDAKSVVADLFAHYMSEPAALPDKWLAGVDRDDRIALARRVCDFIAGMTDRFAIEAHRSLFDHTPDLR